MLSFMFKKKEDNMTPLENKCLYLAEKLHDGVVYGGGLVMLDQIKGTHALLERNSMLDGVEKENALCAALLHKCWESKRIAPEQTPLTMDEVEKYTNPAVRQIVEELASEPEEDKNQTKTQQWQVKAKWAKQLSPAAREILLAEKIQNFEVSRDKPNPAKPLAWHQEYFQTRMLMVEAIKTTNDLLYRQALQTKNEGMAVIQVLMAEKKKERS